MVSEIYRGVQGYICRRQHYTVIRKSHDLKERCRLKNFHSKMNPAIEQSLKLNKSLVLFIFNTTSDGRGQT